MSGLVTGLQNRLRRFESARDLESTLKKVLFFFYGRIKALHRTH